jgi:hypothetical protein
MQGLIFVRRISERALPVEYRRLEHFVGNGNLKRFKRFWIDPSPIGSIAEARDSQDLRQQCEHPFATGRHRLLSFSTNGARDYNIPGMIKNESERV